MEHTDLDKLLDRPILNALGRTLVANALKHESISDSTLQMLKFCSQKSIDSHYIYMKFFNGNRRLKPGELTEHQLKILATLEYYFDSSSTYFEIPVSELDLMVSRFGAWWQNLGQTASSGENKKAATDYVAAYQAVAEFINENPNIWWRDYQTRLARLQVLYVAYLTVRNRHEQSFHISNVAAA